MKQTLFRAICDDKGNVSHARIIALLVGFSATLFMWKLVVLEQLTEEYFFYYLGYGVVHMNVSKFLDVLNTFLGGRNERLRSAPVDGGGVSPSEGRGGRRGRAEPAREDLRDTGDGASVKTEGLDED